MPSPPPPSDPLPPYDEEAERRVLGALMQWDPDVETEFLSLSPSDFYPEQHRKFFEAAQRVIREGIRPSMDSIKYEVERRGWEKEVPPSFILDLYLEVGSAVDVDLYVDRLLLHSQKRRLLRLGQKLTQGATNGTDAEILQQLIQDEANRHAPAATAPPLRPADLIAFDPAEDDTALLGNRYLCRGGSILFVGSTGLGKSTWAMQAAVLWALNRDAFGIQPLKPIRSLIIQAENDFGDLAEQFKGIVGGLNVPNPAETLKDTVQVVTEHEKSGNDFHPFLRSLLSQHRPDIVWIDPLYHYIGGDVSNQERVTQWLRSGLSPSIKRYNCAVAVVHHTTKPKAKGQGADSWQDAEFAYLGAGSSELANWARAVLSLRQTDRNCYELRASKRGTRSGLRQSDGEPSEVIYLEHIHRGICWVRAREPEVQQNEEEIQQARKIVDALPPGTYDFKQLAQAVADDLDKAVKSVIRKGRPPYRILNHAIRLLKDPDHPYATKYTKEGP